MPFRVLTQDGHSIITGCNCHCEPSEQPTDTTAQRVLVFRKQIRVYRRHLLHSFHSRHVHHRSETMRMHPIEFTKILSLPKRNLPSLTRKHHRILPIIEVEHHALMPMRHHPLHEVSHHYHRSQWSQRRNNKCYAEHAVSSL